MTASSDGRTHVDFHIKTSFIIIKRRQTENIIAAAAFILIYHMHFIVSLQMQNVLGMRLVHLPLKKPRTTANAAAHSC